MKLNVVVPKYLADRKEWRRQINAAIVSAQANGRVAYNKDDKLEVQIRFYLRNRKLTILDVDNRLKDVLDSLQGFIGDKGKKGILGPIIPNDNQVYRIVAEKRLPPKKDKEATGTILIRKDNHHPATARSPREFRKHLPAMI